MGVVYRARDTRLGRVVALKVLPEELSRDKERKQRFQREARIASSISHPGIATLYDFDQDGAVSFLTMEYVEGPTLRQLVKEGPLPVDQVLDCGVQVAEALAAAHEKGIVHRDLKPENVMRSVTGHYKVLDFGVARQERRAPASGEDYTHRPTVSWATRGGSLLGTVPYMSPEQTLGRETDARSDIFSFGSLLYELATGKAAFSGANEIAVAQAISFEEPAPMTSHHAGIPPGLEAVVRRCLAKKPEQRYASAADLASDLRVLRLDSQSGVRSTAYRLKALEPLRIRRRRKLALLGVLVAAVAGLAFVLIWLAGAPFGPVDPFRTGVRPVLGTPSGLLSGATATGKPRVIVAFFENNSGDPTADWLSRGLPDMLTTDLSRWDGVEVIAPQRINDLMAMAGRDPGETMDRSTAAELARWAGASLVITGSVFTAGERYRIDAQVYDTQTGTVVAAHKVEGTELFEMVGDLTTGLRERLDLGRTVDAAPAPGVTSAPPAARTAHAPPGEVHLTTASEEAFRIYVEGRDLHENLDYDGATGRFRDALAIDPTFSRARLRLAVSLLLSGDRDGALVHIEEAAGRAAGMPEDARLTSEALHACYSQGDRQACELRLESLAASDPGNGEAYVLWAQVLVELGGNPRAAAQKLRQAMARNPNNLPASVALAGLLARSGATDEAIRLLEGARERNPAARERLQELIDSCSGSEAGG